MRIVRDVVYAELARCFLLQGRGGEGRRRIAPDLLALDLADREAGLTRDLLGGFARGFLVTQIERMYRSAPVTVLLVVLDLFQIGMADAARLDADQSSPGPIRGVGISSTATVLRPL